MPVNNQAQHEIQTYMDYTSSLHTSTEKYDIDQQQPYEDDTSQVTLTGLSTNSEKFIKSSDNIPSMQMTGGNTSPTEKLKR